MVKKLIIGALYKLKSSSLRARLDYYCPITRNWENIEIKDKTFFFLGEKKVPTLLYMFLLDGRQIEVLEMSLPIKDLEVA